MSAALRLNMVADAALKMAPSFAGSFDFSSRGPAWGTGEQTDYEKLIDRSFLAGEAYVAKYEALLIKAQSKDAAELKTINTGAEK